MTYPTMALTIGMTGQERPSLAQLSLGNGYEFHGTARRSRPFNIWQLMLPNDLTRITVRVGTRVGLRLFIDPRAAKHCWSGLYEPLVQEAVAQHLAPGSLVSKVGPHIGFVSAIAARADRFESLRRDAS